MPPDHLQTTATLEHVEMAIELFRKSTMDAVKSGVMAYNVASDPQRARIQVGVLSGLVLFAVALGCTHPGGWEVGARATS